eukprot:6490358-Amphidinium_carterae.1
MEGGWGALMVAAKQVYKQTCFVIQNLVLCCVRLRRIGIACLVLNTQENSIDSHKRTTNHALFGVLKLASLTCLEVVRGKHKKVRLGGAWQGFMRQFSLGRSGTPDIQEVAQHYKMAKQNGTLNKSLQTGSLRTDVRKIFKREGRKVLAKMVKSRDVKTILQKKTQEAFFIKTEGKTFLEVLAMFKDKYGSNNTALVSAVSLAKACSRLETSKLKDVEKQHEETEKTYASVYGNNRKERLVRTLPFLGKATFDCLPHPGFDVLQLQHAHVLESTLKPFAWLSAQPGDQIGPALGKCWTSLHHTIREPDDDAFQPLNKDIAKGTCQPFGVCLCSVEGQKLKKARNRLLQLMKEVFKSKHAKLMLSEGKMVARISLSTLYGVVVPVRDGPKKQYWLHVGSMMWSPYKPTFQMLELVQAPKDEQAADNYIYLKAHQQIVQAPSSPS